ncbi:NADP-dependent oxidoreductase domain-containing protein [Crucibulum laeve]|uniref:NADP-dependent oxidoreductase domain-containing protein n=1 Tax=Crucibulum laeve TaxID=68775 RepID=A0A5C3LYE6_9AGAR|nr:NADP-dependent oxidoreductase domain-containing protein [Crucibulum laeve]
MEGGTRALHAGTHHIDTAQLCKSEVETGEVIKKVGVQRDDVYVTSKISTDDDGNPVPMNSVRSSVEGSLQLLGELKGLWNAFEELKSEGKLKSIAKHGIVTEAFGPLTLVIRHPTGGPLKPVLERIAQRLSKSTRKKIDAAAVLLLWMRMQNVVAVTTSGNPNCVKWLSEVVHLPDLLELSEVDEITKVGKGYTSGITEKIFPLPSVPNGVNNSQRR